MIGEPRLRRERDGPVATFEATDERRSRSGVWDRTLPLTRFGLEATLTAAALRQIAITSPTRSAPHLECEKSTDRVALDPWPSLQPLPG